MGLFAAALSRIKAIRNRQAVRSNCTAQPSPSATHKSRLYSAPELRKLEPEQARLLLTGHAFVGDRGARELLELIFPESGKQPLIGSTSQES